MQHLTNVSADCLQRPPPLLAAAKTWTDIYDACEVSVLNTGWIYGPARTSNAGGTQVEIVDFTPSCFNRQLTVTLAANPQYSQLVQYIHSREWGLRYKYLQNALPLPNM